MKRLLWICLVPALLLTGCGRMTEELAPAAPVQEDQPLMVAEPEPGTDPGQGQESAVQHLTASAPTDFNSITDEQALERLYSGKPNSDYIAGYYAPLDDAFNLHLVPESGEADNGMELISEDDYSICGSYPELDECPTVIPRYLLGDENSRMLYTGATDEAAVLATFDLLTHDQKLLARWYVDDPEIKCLAYDYIAVKDNGDGTAELGWFCYLIDRETMDAFPEWNQTRSISLNGQEPAAQEPDVVYDIELTLSEAELLAPPKTELLVGQDSSVVVVRAVPPAQYNPDGISLIDADTGADRLWLVDDCDYEKHGDNIQGDGWYCNKLHVDTDFGTDPAVSESVVSHFYAQFEEDGVVHRSETVELTVSESFTEEELRQMELVDQELDAMYTSEEWAMADTNGRRELAAKKLKVLLEQGLLAPDSICVSEDMISFRYACGVCGGIGLTPFDPAYN